jgi:hypothetical protein
VNVFPVDKSIIVSAPTTSPNRFSTSSMVEVTALFPMLAFIFTKITSYNHRFTLWMVDVVRDDGVREQLLNEQILV